MKNLLKKQGFVTYKDKLFCINNTLSRRYIDLIKIFELLPKEEYPSEPPKISEKRNMAIFIFEKHFKEKKINTLLPNKGNISELQEIIQKDIDSSESLLLNMIQFFIDSLPLRYNVEKHRITLTFFRGHKDNEVDFPPHQDEEEFLSIFMMYRAPCCEGGINTIYKMDNSKNSIQPVERVLLTKPLEYLIVNDRLMKHDVSAYNFNKNLGIKQVRDFLFISLSSRERPGITAFIGDHVYEKVWGDKINPHV